MFRQDYKNGVEHRHLKDHYNGEWGPPLLNNHNGGGEETESSHIDLQTL